MENVLSLKIKNQNNNNNKKKPQLIQLFDKTMSFFSKEICLETS